MADTAQYRIDIFARLNKDGGGVKIMHTGWQLVKYPNFPEGYEPIDYVSGDVEDRGDKVVTGHMYVDGFHFSDVHGGGHGPIPRTCDQNPNNDGGGPATS